MTARRIASVLAAVAATAVLAGCGSSSSMAIDAADTPISPVTGVEVLDMPPGFGSVLTACHQGNRVYVSEYGEGYSGSPLVVVAADPSCTPTSTEGAAT